MNLVPALVSIGVATIAVMPAPARADDRDRASKLLDDVAACLSIGDPAQRLKCYDSAAAALADATAKKTIVVADRERVLRMRRPSPLTGPDGEAVSQISATITAIQRLSDGRIAFTLDNGSSWIQDDDSTVAGRLQPGVKATVKRAALGTFAAILPGRPGFKVKPQGR